MMGLTSACGLAVEINPAIVPAQDPGGLRPRWDKQPCRLRLVPRRSTVLLGLDISRLIGIPDEAPGVEPGSQQPNVTLAVGQPYMLASNTTLQVRNFGQARIYAEGGGMVTLYAPDTSVGMAGVSRWDDTARQILVKTGALHVVEGENASCLMSVVLSNIALVTAIENSDYVIAIPSLFRANSPVQVKVFAGQAVIKPVRGNAVTLLPQQSVSITAAKVDGVTFTGTRDQVLDHFNSGLDMEGISLSGSEVPQKSPPRPRDVSDYVNIGAPILLAFFLIFGTIILFLGFPSFQKKIWNAIQQDEQPKWELIIKEALYFFFSPVILPLVFFIRLIIWPILFVVLILTLPFMVLTLVPFVGPIILQSFAMGWDVWSDISNRLFNFTPGSYVMKRYQYAQGAMLSQAARVFYRFPLLVVLFEDFIVRGARRLKVETSIDVIFCPLAADPLVDLRIRRKSIGILRQLGRIQALSDLANESAVDVRIRLRAAHELARTRPRQAARAYRLIAEDPKVELVAARIHAAKLLARTPESHPAHLAQAVAILRELLPDRPAADPGFDRKWQARAAQALGELSPEAMDFALDTLKNLARSAYPAEVRYYAIAGLLKLTRDDPAYDPIQQDAFQRLEKLARDPEAGKVRLWLVRYLGHLVETVRLSELASDQKLELAVRQEAARILEGLDVEKAILGWLELARRETTPMESRITAAQTAGNLAQKINRRALRIAAREILLAIGRDMNVVDVWRLQAAEALEALEYTRDEGSIFLALASDVYVNPEVARRAKSGLSRVRWARPVL